MEKVDVLHRTAGCLIFPGNITRFPDSIIYGATNWETGENHCTYSSFCGSVCQINFSCLLFTLFSYFSILHEVSNSQKPQSDIYLFWTCYIIPLPSIFVEASRINVRNWFYSPKNLENDSHIAFNEIFTLHPWGFFFKVEAKKYEKRIWVPQKTGYRCLNVLFQVCTDLEISAMKDFKNMIGHEKHNVENCGIERWQGRELCGKDFGYEWIQVLRNVSDVDFHPIWSKKLV